MGSNCILSVVELQALIARAGPLVLIDTRFDLADPDAGQAAWAQGHLPGARYAHLDRDLCGPTTDSKGRFLGRHPLPERDVFAQTLGKWGISPETPVVVYDAAEGMFAARLWWMLRWMGHGAVAVLDGGLSAWVRAGNPLEALCGSDDARTDASRARATQAAYPERPPLEQTISGDALAQSLHQVRLIDARAPERFRGEVEPLDALAGHIPGARNRFFKANLAADGRFKPAPTLRAEFGALAAPHGSSPHRFDVVHQCGSGVTACHNLLAMRHAGLMGGSLYVGSWSEWCRDSRRPTSRG
jgi:thiosulfate/3-mercaptopyruvate sulfurtransferase